MIVFTVSMGLKGEKESYEEVDKAVKAVSRVAKRNGLTLSVFDVFSATDNRLGVKVPDPAPADVVVGADAEKVEDTPENV